MTATFSRERHRCRVPVDEVPDERGWVGYWLCPDCRSEYRLTRGEHGARMLDQDGQFVRWVVGYQRVS